MSDQPGDEFSVRRFLYELASGAEFVHLADGSRMHLQMISVPVQETFERMHTEWGNLCEIFIATHEENQRLQAKIARINAGSVSVN